MKNSHTETAERRRQKEQVFAETLEVVRDHFRLSNVKLAARTGIPTSTVRNKVTGTYGLSAAEMDDFAQALGVPVLVLYMGPAEAKTWLVENRRERTLEGDLPLRRYGSGAVAVAA